jgi:transportin-1
MLILFDGIGIFAESSISGQGRVIMDRFSSVVLPPLIEKWTSYSDDDRALYTLAECLMAITLAVRMSLQPYAEAIYRRCLNIIETNLVAFAVRI